MKRKTDVLALLVCAAAIVGMAAPPAAAATSAVTVIPMTTLGIDPEVAAANGYEVREDDHGFLYTAPIGSPDTGEAVGPTIAKDRGGAGLINARGEIRGNCGTSFINGGAAAKRFSTGYTILPKYGSPVSHLWSATTWSGGGMGVFDLSGIPSLGSSGWAASRNVTTSGSFQSAMASGTVFTNTGWICGSGDPTWAS